MNEPTIETDTHQVPPTREDVLAMIKDIAADSDGMLAELIADSKEVLPIIRDVDPILATKMQTAIEALVDVRTYVLERSK